jgi:fructuronate reductase
VPTVEPLLSRAPSDPAPPVRIVHLGLGNFMRAHLAWYTAHSADAGSWGIAAFTGRSPHAPHGLVAQQGVYTLTTRSAEQDDTEIITSMAAVHGTADHDAWLKYCSDPQVRIITLTVTEAGYHFEPDDPRHATEVEDLRRDPRTPVVSAVPRLVAGLAARRAAAAGGLALLPCDNLPSNGAVLASVVAACAERVDPTLREWIAQNVTTANTMVDRITPALSEQAAAEVNARTGVRDLVPVVTEPFTEWIIAGDFPHGRPSWAANFVDDVRPYEQRKLWLLNGAHSLLAYHGLARGHATVAEAVADPDCRHWITRWWNEASAHLSLDGDELAQYRLALTTRFANPRMHHRLGQIATDGSEKIRARILPVLLAHRAAGLLPEAACRTVGAWVAHLRREGDTVADAHVHIVAALLHDELETSVKRILAWLHPELAADEEVHRRVVAGAAVFGG